MSGVERSTAFHTGYRNALSQINTARPAARTDKARPAVRTDQDGPVNLSGQTGAGGEAVSGSQSISANPGSQSISASQAGYGARPSADSVELSADRNPPVSESMITDLFDILSQDYPGIAILEERPGGTHDVKKMAVELGKGTYVIVSREFLERMGRSQEDYEACKSVLMEALRRLAAGSKDMESQGVYLRESSAVSWYVPDRSESEALKKAIEASGQKGGGTAAVVSGTGMHQSAENDYRKPVTVSYSTMNHFSGMARAGSKGEVKKVLSDVHRSINNLRLAAVYGDEKERMKARRAMRSLQKLLARGSRKIRKLDQEEILNVRRKKAERNRKEKKVRQITLELKKRRSSRKGADYRLIQEGISDTYMILGSKRGRSDYEQDRLVGSFDPYTAGTLDLGVGMTGGGDFSEAEVVVSSEIAF